jgi:hypothetical protein
MAGRRWLQNPLISRLTLRPDQVPSTCRRSRTLIPTNIRDGTIEQAANLSATVSDCRVTQIANPIQGIHCLNPKQTDHKEDLDRPTAETPQHYVTYAKDASMNKAMDAASWSMIKLLQEKKNLNPLDAYGLVSLAMDCRIGAVSSAEKSIHCLLPKSMWQ